jgi:hypothetical protein
MVGRQTGIAASIALAAVLLLASATAKADGVSAVKDCEGDSSPPEDVARLTIMPNGESRGSTSAAGIIRIARERAKAGKDAEAVAWAALCNFFEPKEQEAIRRDSAAVLQYLKQ